MSGLGENDNDNGLMQSPWVLWVTTSMQDDGYFGVGLGDPPISRQLKDHCYNAHELATFHCSNEATQPETAPIAR